MPLTLIDYRIYRLARLLGETLTLGELKQIRVGRTVATGIEITELNLCEENRVVPLSMTDREAVEAIP